MKRKGLAVDQQTLCLNMNLSTLKLHNPVERERTFYMGVKVSVIIPTFNRGNVIGETLESVRAQTLTEWECIVVDDGSSDDTEELMKTYQEMDPRFTFIKRPTERNKGACTCRNIGLEHAKGEYIQFLDSDDLISNNKLEEQVKRLESIGDLYAISTCRWEYFTNFDQNQIRYSNKPTYKNFESPLQLLDVFGSCTTYIPQHVYLMSKALIDKAGPWSEQLVVNQDGEFFVRVLIRSSRIIFATTAYAYYRTSTGGNISTLSNEKKARGMVESWQLIDLLIQEKFGVANHAYVKQAKTGLSKRIKAQHPRVFNEHREFFASKRSLLEHFYLKIRAKILFMYLNRFRKMA